MMGVKVYFAQAPDAACSSPQHMNMNPRWFIFKLLTWTEGRKKCELLLWRKKKEETWRETFQRDVECRHLYRVNAIYYSKLLPTGCVWNTSHMVSYQITDIMSLWVWKLGSGAGGRHHISSVISSKATEVQSVWLIKENIHLENRPVWLLLSPTANTAGSSELRLADAESNQRPNETLHRVMWRW